MKEIKLGSKVKDKVTGFTGIATSKVEYINGCVQYGVKPKKGSDGKMLDVEYIDVDQIEVIGEGVNVKRKKTGGVMPDCPKH